MKIVFCEHSVINALEAAVQVYAVFEGFYIGFAEESADEVVDRELSLPTSV